MSVFRIFFVFLSELVPPRVPVFSAEDHKNIVTKVISIVATGSVSLQSGRFVTERNIDERKKLLSCYKF